VIVVVPRLVARLTGFQPRFPTGEQTWGDTVLALPEGFGGASLFDVVTGERVDPDVDEGWFSLPASRLFSILPIAAMVAEDKD
jgi:hypothetical protein